HQQRHRQRRHQHHDPGCHMHVRISHAKKIQTDPHDASENEAAKRRLCQNRQHHFFPPFAVVFSLAFATWSANKRNCRWSSMAVSTMPTRTSSTEPLQNQSTMRWTALAATRPRGSAAW